MYLYNIITAFQYPIIVFSIINYKIIQPELVVVPKISTPFSMSLQFYFANNCIYPTYIEINYLKKINKLLLYYFIKVYK